MDQMIGGHNAGSGRVMVLVVDGFDNIAVGDAATGMQDNILA